MRVRLKPPFEKGGQGGFAVNGEVSGDRNDGSDRGTANPPALRAAPFAKGANEQPGTAHSPSEKGGYGDLHFPSHVAKPQ